jgi:DNA-directed RNA polymerase subunit H (RpoH/RPB5)
MNITKIHLNPQWGSFAFAGTMLFRRWTIKSGARCSKGCFEMHIFLNIPLEFRINGSVADASSAGGILSVLKKKNLSTKDYFLNPEFRVLDEKGKKEVLAKYGVTAQDLPKILMIDPVAVELKLKVGDLVEIRRKDQTGEYLSYRVAFE